LSDISNLGNREQQEVTTPNKKKTQPVRKGSKKEKRKENLAVLFPASSQTECFFGFYL